MRTKIDALMDSVYTIDQILQNNESDLFKKDILEPNVKHIELCLASTEYTSELTPEQVSELNRALEAAKAKIAILNEQAASENQ